MMKALLSNGSPHEHGCTYTALAELAKTLEAEGIETEEQLEALRGCGVKLVQGFLFSRPIPFEEYEAKYL